MQPNPWKPSRHSRRPAVLMEPIEESGCWYPQDLVGTDAWVYRLSDREISDVMDAISAVKKQGLDIKEITKADFSLPVLAPALKEIKSELMEGRGFALIRGLPIDGMSPYEYTAAFWGVSTHVGQAISQNGEGHLIGHVTNKGNSLQTQTGRGYRSNEELFFHCDRCDVAGLMTLRLAKAGGQHRICSSVAVYNEMLKRRPELAEALTFHFYMSRRGEIPAGETEPWFRQPVFSVKDGYFSARGASATGIVRAQELPGVEKLTPEQRESIDVYQEFANELSLDIDFQPGDMSYAQSHVTLHARTEFEDWPEHDRRRHLLRMWINTGGERPLVPEVGREIERGIVLDRVKVSVPLEA